MFFNRITDVLTMDSKVHQLVVRESQILKAARENNRQRIAYLYSQIEDLNEELDSIKETDEKLERVCQAIDNFLVSLSS